jgi:hypothetical protein
MGSSSVMLGALLLVAAASAQSKMHPSFGGMNSTTNATLYWDTYLGKGHEDGGYLLHDLSLGNSPLPQVTEPDKDGFVTVNMSHHVTDIFGRQHHMDYNVTYHQSALRLDKRAGITKVTCANTSVTITFNSSEFRAAYDNLWINSRNVVNGTPVTGGSEWGCLNKAGTKVSTIYRLTAVNANNQTHTVSADGKSVTVFTTVHKSLHHMFKNSKVSHHTNQYKSTSDGRRGSTVSPYTGPWMHGRVPRPQAVKIPGRRLLGSGSRRRDSRRRRSLWGDITHAADDVAHAVVHVADAVANAVSGTYSWDDSKQLAAFGYNFKPTPAAVKTPITIFDKTYQTTVDGANVQATADVSCENCYAGFTLSTAIDLDTHDWSVSKIEASFTGAVDVKMEAVASVQLKITKDGSIPLGTIPGPTISFELGIIPVEIHISIPVAMKYSSEFIAKGSITVSAGLSASKTLGISYLNDAWGTINTGTFEKDFSVDPVLQGTITASVGLVATITVEVESIAQVDIAATPSVNAKAAMSTANSACAAPNVVLSSWINFEITITIGVDISFMGHQLWKGPTSKPYTLFNEDWYIAGYDNKCIRLVPPPPPPSPPSYGWGYSWRRSEGAAGRKLLAADDWNKKTGAWNLKNSSWSAQNSSMVQSSLPDHTSTSVAGTRNSSKCFLGGCSIATNLTYCVEKNGQPVCAAKADHLKIDASVHLNVRKLIVKGPQCVDNMKTHMCDLAFPLCTSATSDHALVPRKNAECVAAFTSCGIGASKGAEVCDSAAKGAVHPTVALDSGKKCGAKPAGDAKLADFKKGWGKCEKASGLSVCSSMEGKMVYVYDNLFKSVAMAESFINYMTNQNAPTSDATCKKSYTKWLCSQYLPECNAKMTQPKKLCGSACFALSGVCKGKVSKEHPMKWACNTSKPVIAQYITHNESDCGHRDTGKSLVDEYRKAHGLKQGKVNVALTLDGIGSSDWNNDTQTALKTVIAKAAGNACGLNGTTCTSDDISLGTATHSTRRAGSTSVTGSVATSSSKHEASSSTALNSYLKSPQAKTDLNNAGVATTGVSGSSSTTSSSGSNSSSSGLKTWAVVVIAVSAAVAAVAVVVAAAVIISKRKNKPLQPTPQTQTSAIREEPSPGVAVTMGSATAEDTDEAGQV